MSPSSSSPLASPTMLTLYSSPMLTLATYSQPHRPSSPAAHFPIERETDRVPPSIKRRTTSTPSLSNPTSSSSTMNSQYNFGIRRLPEVIDEVEIVDDDAEYHHSDVSAFQLQPVTPTSAAPSIRPKLQRRDTPIPPTTLSHAERSPVRCPSTAFSNNLRSETNHSIFIWTRKRRDTPRPVARPECLPSLSNKMLEERRSAEVFEKPHQEQEQPKRKGGRQPVVTGNVGISNTS